MTQTLVAIQSVAFPGKYIRLDASGLTSFQPAGGGKVGTQTYIGTYETFILRNFPDGLYSFESSVFPNTFLRLDGASVKAGELVGPGGGTVNAQFGSFDLEKFHIRSKDSGTVEAKGIVGIESQHYPGRFLRMGGDDIVNVQGVFKTNEEFKVLVVG